MQIKVFIKLTGKLMDNLTPPSLERSMDVICSPALVPLTSGAMDDGRREE